jgi:hypothetical protein
MIMTAIEPANMGISVLWKYIGKPMGHKINENFMQYFFFKKKCTLLSWKYGNTANLYFGNKRVKLLCTVKRKILLHGE